MCFEFVPYSDWYDSVVVQLTTSTERPCKSWMKMENIFMHSFAKKEFGKKSVKYYAQNRFLKLAYRILRSSILCFFWFVPLTFLWQMELAENWETKHSGKHMAVVNFFFVGVKVAQQEMRACITLSFQFLRVSKLTYWLSVKYTNNPVSSHHYSDNDE